ncbi:hypothetical protein [Rhizobium sp.]
MGPKNYPEAEDRGESVVRRQDDNVVVLDDERRRRLSRSPDTNANNEADEPGSDGGGAQNEPI